MEELEMFSRIAEMNKKLREIQDLSGGNMKYEIDTLRGSYTDMFERFCPLMVGDKAVLIQVPDFEASHGWSGCKHFMIQGASVTVKTREFRKGLFRFGVHFDNESWLDHKGEENPMNEPNLFFLSEKSLMGTGG